MGWANYVALGDSLTAGRDDHGPEGARIGWARRLAGILTARTSVCCALTNLAVDGASAGVVLGRQLPSVAGLGPDLVSVTVGMNDIRDPGFTPERFTAELGLLLDGLAATGATVLTCTLPDIAAIMPLPAHLVEVARQRMCQASDIIRKQAAELDDSRLYLALAYGHWFTYSPFAAIVFVPVAALPLAVARVGWDLVSVAALAYSCTRIVQLAGYRPTRLMVAGFVAAAMALDPVWETLFLGQINLVLLALILTDVWLVSPG